MAGTSTTALVPPITFDPLQGQLQGSCGLGVLTVATILHNAGHAVAVADPQARVEAKPEHEIITELAQPILSTRPRIIGFSATCGLYALTLLLAERCKQLAPSSLVILGGPQASARWQETLEQCGWIDLIVVGEADLTVGPLWECLATGGDLSGIPGLAFRHRAGLRYTGPARRLDDLDQLPLPDYRLLPRTLWEREPSLTLEAGRGCPYRCRFCSTSLFWGRHGRMKSASRILREIHQVMEQTKHSSFYLAHDMLATQRPVLEELCQELSKLTPPPRWACSARVDALDQPLLEQMAAAGCNEIRIGLESASDRIQRLVNKRIDLPRAWSMFDRLRAVGIRPAISLIVGFPDETEAELLATLALALDPRHESAPRAQVQIFVLAPLAGTELLRRHESELRLDRFLNPTLDSLPFSGPRCMAFVQDHPALCSAAYHYHSPRLPRDTVLKTSLLFRQVRQHVASLGLLQRAFGTQLPSVLYRHLDAFPLESVPSGQSMEALEESTERLLDDVWSDAQVPVPYWRDLFRYESVWIRLRRLPEAARKEGMLLALGHDVRGLIDRLRHDQGIPLLTPAPHPLPLWCAEIEGRLREVLLSPSLANAWAPSEDS